MRPQVGDLKAAYINAVSQSKQLEWDATRLESMAADQAVPGKLLREAQTKLAQQQTTTANARQQLVNLGFSAEKIDSLVVAKDTSPELPLETPWPGIIVCATRSRARLSTQCSPVRRLRLEHDVGLLESLRVRPGASEARANHYLCSRRTLRPRLHRQDRLDQSPGRPADAHHASPPKSPTPTGCCGQICTARKNHRRSAARRSRDPRRCRARLSPRSGRFRPAIARDLCGPADHDRRQARGARGKCCRA